MRGNRYINFFGTGAPVGGPLPLDAVSGVTFQGAYGTKSLTKSWLNGNLFDVLVGATTTTVKAIKGKCDVITLAAALGISPSSGIGGAPAPKWYDQSGSGSDITQAVLANTPWIFLINGQVYIVADGWLADNLTPPRAGTANRFYNFPNIAINTRSFSAYAVVRPLEQAPAFTTILANTSPGLFSIGAAGTSWAWWGADASVVDLVGAFQVVAPPSPIPSPSNNVVHGIVSGPASVTFNVNENSGVSAGPLTAGTLNSGHQLFASNFGNPVAFTGRAQAFVLTNQILTAGQQTALKNAFYQWAAITPKPRINALVHGASVDYGTGAYVNDVIDGTAPVATAGWEQFMIDDLAGIAKVSVASSYGINVAQLAATWGSGGFAPEVYYDPTAAINVLFATGFAFHNSFTGGQTGAQTFASLSAYLTAARSNGRVWNNVFVMQANDGNQQSTDYNALLLANAVALNYTVLNFGIPGPAIPSGPSAGHFSISEYNSFYQSIKPTVRASLGV